MSDLDTQIAQAQARLKDLQAKARRMKRRGETRRKILYGAAVLLLVEEFEGEQRQRLLKRLHAHIRRDKDRVFLGLPNKTCVPHSRESDGQHEKTCDPRKAE